MIEDYKKPATWRYPTIGIGEPVNLPFTLCHAGKLDLVQTFESQEKLANVQVFRQFSEKVLETFDSRC